MDKAKNKSKVWSWVLLIALAIGIGGINTFCQWTTISTDPDFTAWGTALANHLGPRSKLYGPGMHMPVAPLTYAFLYAVSGGHGHWLTESFWNQVSIMGTLMAMTWLLQGVFSARVTFLTALCMLGVYSKIHTVLLYCSMTNMFVAFLACAVVVYLKRKNLKWMLVTAFLAALVLLSKQSIGVLTTPATALVIFAVPESLGLWPRIKPVVIYALAFGLSIVLLCLLISPVVDIHGMIIDVFLTGAECKGGTGEVVGKLVGFACDICSSMAFGTLILGMAVGAGVCLLPKRQNKPASLPASAGWLAMVLAAGIFYAFASGRLQLFGLPDVYQMLHAGLVSCVFFALVILVKPRPLLPLFDSKEVRLLGTLTIILLPAAAGYCLSSFIGWRSFLWWVDSMPFIQVALTAIVYFAFEGIELLPERTLKISSTVLAIALIATTWQPWRIHWLEIKQCTDVWQGVDWFKGARITTRARPLETLVNEVRSLTKPDEAVLFLPDDPSLEECFDRPRPALNCPVVFTDQYWVKYVDDDFNFLKRNPPKVIILGPKDSWVKINDLRNDSGAVKTLIQRVQMELLPAHYKMVDAHQINYGNGIDYLDVWVRVD